MVDESDGDDFEPDYENRVGYGNPPKHSRWVKGVSGNPSGRPRKALSRKYILQKVARRQVEYLDGSKKVRATQLEAIVLIVKSLAISGNRAAQKIYERLQGIVDTNDDSPPAPKGVLFTREKMSPEEWNKQAELYLAGLPNLFDDQPKLTEDDS